MPVHPPTLRVRCSVRNSRSVCLKALTRRAAMLGKRLRSLAFLKGKGGRGLAHLLAILYRMLLGPLPSFRREKEEEEWRASSPPGWDEEEGGGEGCSCLEESFGRPSFWEESSAVFCSVEEKEEVEEEEEEILVVLVVVVQEEVERDGRVSGLRENWFDLDLGRGFTRNEATRGGRFTEQKCEQTDPQWPSKRATKEAAREKEKEAGEKKKRMRNEWLQTEWKRNKDVTDRARKERSKKKS